MKAKSSKFRILDGTARTRLQDDYDILLDSFSSLGSDPDKIEGSLSVLKRMASILCGSPELVFLEFYNCWKEYPDLPLDYIEEILSKRDDLDKAKVKEIMESCRQKAGTEKLDSHTTTLFSSMK